MSWHVQPFKDFTKPAENPVAVRSKVLPLQMTLCLACDVGQHASLADLRSWLSGLDLYGQLARPGGTVFASCQDGPEHPHVTVTGSITAGMRAMPAIASMLAALHPGLELAVDRYHHPRHPANEAIIEALVARFGNEIALGREEGSGERSGDPWRLGARDEEADIEPLATTLARAAVAPWASWLKKRHVRVKVESGLRVVVTRFLRGGMDTLIQLEGVDPTKGAGDGAWVRQRFGWAVLDWYIDHFDHVPEVHALRAWSVGREEVPLVVDVLNEHLRVAPEVRARVIGDLAVLQFMVQRRAAVFPVVKVTSELLKALRFIQYPRLPRRVAEDPNVVVQLRKPSGMMTKQDDREVLEAIVRDIGRDLETVVVEDIDWAPVLGRMHFKQRKKRERRKTKR